MKVPASIVERPRIVVLSRHKLERQFPSAMRAYRIPRRLKRLENSRRLLVLLNRLLTLASRGISMNTKLVLSALVAALMLSACAKQEATAPAAEPPAAEAPAADPAAPAAEATPPADAVPPADAAPPADGAAAPAEPPKQ
jgi:hypothetical protein